MRQQRVKLGRPRDEAAADAIRHAALRLVRTRGYRSVTIDLIAAEAGVARQTLYNRWSKKADLVLDAVFIEAGELTDHLSTSSTATGADRLERFLATLFRHLDADEGTLRSLVAAAQEDDNFRAAFRDRFVLPREALVTNILLDAIRQKELPADSDPNILAIMIHGAFWYRLLNGLVLDDQLARAITCTVFAPKLGPY